MNLQSPTPLKNQPAPNEGGGRTSWVRRYVIGGGALILVLGGYWYYNNRAAPTPRGPRVAAAAVRVAKVEHHDMAVVERTVGTVLANQTVQVTPMVQGTVQQAFFKEGQMVKKGDLLFQIDPRPFEAALGLAKGQLAKDQASLDGAQRDLQRYQTLSKQNAVAQQIVDDQIATVASDRGTVEADTANVQTATLNVEYTKIRAPVDGQTGPITVMPGNIISVTGTNSTVNPLVIINQIHPVKISFFLPQTDLPRIEARQKQGGLVATISLDDAGGSSFTIPINFISNQVSNSTGTIELRATYDNPAGALVPGQQVNVVVGLSNIAGATIIPHDALTAGPDGQYVYTVSDGRAQQVPVTVLFDDTKNIAVEGELSEGQTVVVDGQLDVVPGGRVEIVEGAQAGGAQQRSGGKRKGGRHGGAARGDNKL